ncbi:MAG TPA: hypothetical protein VGQ52_09330, partial [Gemmatimonadaceae bacterium]|nr:hypothetical protein [Gemmatimonadaceae bacterium]
NSIDANFRPIDFRLCERERGKSSEEQHLRTSKKKRQEIRSLVAGHCSSAAKQKLSDASQ